MTDNHDRKVPFEIPVEKNPGKAEPTKDPLSPNEKNPINPQTDEPEIEDQGDMTQKRE